MKKFLALSRTAHGVLDLAAPGFCALLVLGGFPAWQTTVLSIFTAFAAYTAIYALNDLVGMQMDREKFAGEGINAGYSVEASAERYPLAQNILGYKSGFIWMAGWLTLALIGAYLLNPVIIGILIAAAILEVIYCRLLKVTYLRTLFSGLVKISGPIAAVFVVSPNPSAYVLLLIFGWLFFWEIGGQNIPADWNDTAEDKRVNAKTIPIHFGFNAAGWIVIVTLSATVMISAFLPAISPLQLGIPFISGSLLIGFLLLLRPAFQLHHSNKEGREAARLFDHASYYPLAQLAWITVFVVFSQIAG